MKTFVAILLAAELLIAYFVLAPTYIHRHEQVRAYAAWHDHPTPETRAELDRQHRITELHSLGFSLIVFAVMAGPTLLIARRWRRQHPVHQDLSDSTTSTTASPQSRVVWPYAGWSFLFLFAYVLIYPAFMQPHRHLQNWTMSWLGLVCGLVVAANCLWWFLRCPKHHWLVKVLTCLFFIISLLIVFFFIYSKIAYRLYGVAV